MHKPGLFLLLTVFLFTTRTFSQPWFTKDVDYHGHCKAHLFDFSANCSGGRSGTYEQNPLLHKYDVSFYKLDVHVEPNNQFIDGMVTIKAEVSSQSLDTLVLELKHNMNVDEVLVNNELCNFDHTGNEIHIYPDEPFQEGAYFKVQIIYSGSPVSDGFFSGMHTGTTPYGDPVMWTLSEPVNARQWWPCKQVLEDKADSVHVFITTSQQYMTASNGLLKNIVQLPDNKVRYEWKSNYPIAYYLISLAVTKYKEYNFYAPLSSPGDSVFVQNFVYDHPDVLPTHQVGIDRTKYFMELFSQLYGDYPFSTEKYGHAMAPMGGGMEHQTISTMSSFGYNLTSHELAHHWFGNNVTCATWNDIWINEGFATYSEYLAIQHLEGQADADNWMKNTHNSVISKPDGSVYIPISETTDVWRIFNGRLSYRKGSSILHLLRFEINNDELFFDIFREFQDRFKDSVATGDDFREVVDDLTAQNWEWFFEQWYYGEGHPRFNIKWYQEKDSVFIIMNQQGSAENSLFFKTSAEFKLISNDKDSIFRLFQSEKDQSFSFYYPYEISKIVFDPRGWLFKEYESEAAVPGELKPPALSVYPNPFTTHIYVKVDGIEESGEYYYINIFNNKGQKVYGETISPSGTKIESSCWSSGLYIISVSDKKGNYHYEKLIKSF